MLGFLKKILSKTPETPEPPKILPSVPVPTYSMRGVTTYTAGATGYFPFAMSGSYLDVSCQPPSHEDLKEKASKFKKFSLTPTQNSANI